MALKLSFDVTTGNLVSWQGSSASLPSNLRQGRVDVQVRFVQPLANSIPGLANYEAADTTAYLGVRLGVWSNATGTLNDSSEYLLALIPHTDFAYNDDDADDPYYTGTLDLLTQEIADEMGTAKTLAAYFAVGLLRADLTLEPIYDQRGQSNITIYAASDDASGAMPISVAEELRIIELPVYFRSADGARLYVVTENGDQTGLLFTRFTPP